MEASPTLLLQKQIVKAVTFNPKELFCLLYARLNQTFRSQSMKLSRSPTAFVITKIVAQSSELELIFLSPMLAMLTLTRTQTCRTLMMVRMPTTLRSSEITILLFRTTKYSRLDELQKEFKVKRKIFDAIKT